MLDHEHQSSEAVPVSQYRVSPSELAQAIAELEAQQTPPASAEADTIALGTAIEELNLTASAEELWAAVEKVRLQQQALRTAPQRVSRTRSRRKRVFSTVVGLALVLVSAPFWRARAINRTDHRAGGLLSAVHHDDLKQVESWLALGIDPNSRAEQLSPQSVWRTLVSPTKGRLPALIIAANHGNLAVTEALLRSGAQANIRDEMGSTALHWLAGRSVWTHADTLTLKCLLNHGADIHLRNERGETPLDYARILAPLRGNNDFQRAYEQITSAR